jgi:signal transduction histidine kinase
MVDFALRRALRWASMVVWAAVSASFLLECERALGAWPLSCWIGWLLAMGLCGLSFWLPFDRLSSGGGGSSLAIVLTIVQTVAIVRTMLVWQSPSPGFLLLFTAWQAGQLLPIRSAILWAVAQGAATVALSVSGMPETWLVYGGVFAGLGIFAVLLAELLRRERGLRRGLEIGNRELRAAQEVIAQSSRQAERLHLSRELHDGLGHRLTALALALEAASSQDCGAARPLVERARAATGDLLSELRGVVSDIREGERLDLERALAGLIADVERPVVHLRRIGELTLDDPERAHALVRCVQEILHNAIKHAGAENLWIDLVATSDGIVLKARDDGQAGSSNLGPVREGTGLRGLRERLGLLGGRFHWAADEGSGFTATIWMPAGRRP